MAVLEKLSEEEAYLLAILADESGLDQAEFLWYEPSHIETHGCFRAWPFQHRWWRDSAKRQIDQAARAVGKSLSLQVRACAFPVLHAGQEMLITAPEGNHLEAVTDWVEKRLLSVRFYRELLKKVGSNNGIKHRPFQINFRNNSRIMGRIPQRDGKGVKGCVSEGTLILTEHGLVQVEDLKVGDRVMTHENRWRPIIQIREDINDAYEVKGAGSWPMVVSCDHRFLGAVNEGKPKGRRVFEGLVFEDVEHLGDFYWATPMHFPHADLVGVKFSAEAKRFEAEGEDFWWLVGRYLADGYASFNGASSKRVHWVVVPDEAIEVTKRLDAIGLKYDQIERSHSSADVVETCSTPFANWLEQVFGRRSDVKSIPAFCLSMDLFDRMALLDGYLSGDGHWNEGRQRWEVGSASKALALSVQLLAQSLGWSVNCSSVEPVGGGIVPIKAVGEYKTSWRIQLTKNGHSVEVDDHLVGKVKSLRRLAPVKVFDLVVEEDHSYLSGSIMSHNMHPLWLEMDESQDYPEAGWTELFQTLNTGMVGAKWRSHGVTRGVRDQFWKFTQPDSGWQVHRITAMHKPTWDDVERAEAIENYGSENHPDYRRNILGLHGDVMNPLFVLHRLMKCVDLDPTSEYSHEFVRLNISDEMILDYGGEILQCLDLPLSHEKYKVTWAGMDVGLTNHPSEILVFAEERVKGMDESRLKLLSRFHLERVSAPDQRKAIMWLVNFYRLRAFSMDKTGLGLPIYQELQEMAKNDPNVANVLETIKGYNFSEKILVDFDESVDVREFGGDEVEDRGIYRKVLEFSSDKLREYVDKKRLLLPDDDIVKEFQGQTWTYDKAGIDMYGRKTYSKGSFHALDAARMAILGHVQAEIEAFMREHKRIKQSQPVFDVFVSP